MGKPHLAPAAFEERAVQGCKQPGLHFRLVPELVAFGRPHIKRLLRQVARVGLGACQAESELIERLVIRSHYAFKIQAWTHNNVIFIKSNRFAKGSQFSFCAKRAKYRGKNSGTNLRHRHLTGMTRGMNCRRAGSAPSMRGGEAGRCGRGSKPRKVRIVCLPAGPFAGYRSFAFRNRAFRLSAGFLADRPHGSRTFNMAKTACARKSLASPLLGS